MVDGGHRHAGQLGKFAVAPHHALVPQLHQHCREGACALTGAFQGIGGSLQILADAPVAGLLVAQMDEECRAGGNQLRRAQQVLPHHHRTDGEAHHQHIVNCPGWPEQPNQLFIHAPRSFPFAGIVCAIIANIVL